MGVNSEDMRVLAIRLETVGDKADGAVLARKMFEDLTNFSQLRDPVTWGTGGLWAAVVDEQGSIDKASRARTMLQHTADRIAEPLTKLRKDRELESTAMRNFTNIMRAMGDKPNAFVADNQKPILKAVGSKDTDLCDEVYIQLMKQLTMNPSADSAAKGWSLMIALVNQGLPSEELSAFLSAFLKR